MHRKPHKRRLNTLYALSQEAATFGRTWDTKQPGLVLRVQGDARSYYLCYRFNKRARWLKLCDALKRTDKDARILARKLQARVDEGIDPAAEKRAERASGTFAEIYERYLDRHAKKHNRSWAQSDGWVRRYVLPRWAKLPIKSIGRSDVRNVIGGISAPIAANQTLAAASAFFSWAVEQELIETNPAQKVKRNPTQSRNRVLNESEVPWFWQAFDTVGLRGTALKVVLLTGQRPGEVSRMRWEHIKDGWWQLPGKPDPNGWPGTKNGEDHLVRLPQPVRDIINQLNRCPLSGFVFDTGRGKPPDELHGAMREVNKTVGVSPKVTPHDLRRTHGSMITRLGFGRDAMNRIQNHREGGISDVYDQHQYLEENTRIMEDVAARLLALAEGKAEQNNVVPMTKGL